MIALQIDFIAGRFHASPWEDGIAGGEIEWPPSPWRLLCSIVAGWRQSGAAQSETLLHSHRRPRRVPGI
jgi:CRISPR-associated protein Csb2